MSDSSFSTYKRMMVFIKPYLPLFVLASLMGMIVSLMNSISIWFLSTLPKMLFTPDSFTMQKPEFSFQNINEFLKYWSYSLITGTDNGLLKICVLVIIAFLFKNLFDYSAKALTNNINFSVSRDMRSYTYRHVMNLPISYFDKNETGKIIAYMVNDMNAINISITQTLQILAAEPLKLIINISILFMVNWKLTLLVFVIYPVLGFIIVKVGKSVKRRYKREVEAYQALVTQLTETVSGIRAVKMFSMHDSEFNTFNALNRKHKRYTLKTNLTKEIISPITEILGITVTAVLLLYSGNQIIHGTSNFTADDFVRFIFFLIASYAPLKQIGNVNNIIQAGVTSGKRVFSLIDEKEEKFVNTHKTIHFDSAISFENVRFTYPGFENEVLKGMSFNVSKGSKVAIIGSSGAGKSTILDLLPRFYDITGGSIAIDGISTAEMDLVALRSLFGIVSQETVLFNMSVKDNIAYGTDATDEDILRAVRSANALEFIEKLPEGFDTIIGERGVTLSGGQRQRLAIARALLRNPQILILDEATSALDTESEKLVQEAIDTLTENRTAFIVAHRLSTILHADRIMVVEDGRIVEEGTHKELFELGNRYRYFYDIQFSGEKEQSETATE